MSLDILTLAMAKKHSDGATSNLSYNGLADRPFYEDVTYLEEVMIENASSSENISIFSLKFEAGTIYRVIWDGKEYDCTAYGSKADAQLGNSSLWKYSSYTGGNDEPFLFIYNINAQYIVICTDSDTEHIYSIYKFSEPIIDLVQIDEKFIPNTIARVSDIPDISDIPQSDWNIYDEKSQAFIKNKPFFEEQVVETETAVKENVSFTVESDFSKVDDMGIRLSLGQIYKVVWDGVEYICVASGNQFSNKRYLGNMSLINSGEDTGEPFLFYYDDEDVSHISYDIYVAEKDVEHTYSAYRQTYTTVIHQLDEKYIPETIHRVGNDVIINSSTEGSTKKFKITVDDTGAISATEVIE